MKRLLILVLFAVFAATAAQAQQKTTLAECGGDTVLYLRKSFDERKVEFVGQPFSKVLDEWTGQLPVGHLVFGDTGSWPTKDEEKYLVKSATLYYNSETEINLRWLQKEPYYGISILFEPPFSYQSLEFYQLQDEENLSLGPQLYEKLKDYTVKDIRVFEMKKNW